MSNEQKLMHVALEAINALMIGAERDSDNEWGRICMPTNSAMSKGADAAMATRQALATTEPAVNQQLTTDPFDEREAFEKWLGIKPCGAAHDFGWSAWQARAAMAQGVKG